VGESQDTTWLVLAKKLFHEYLKPNGDKSILFDSTGNALVDSEVDQLTTTFEQFVKDLGIEQALKLFESTSKIGCRAAIISSVPEWLISLFPALKTSNSTVSDGSTSALASQCDVMVGAILCKFMQKNRESYLRSQSPDVMIETAASTFAFGNGFAKKVYAPIKLGESFHIGEVTFEIKSVVMKTVADPVDHFVAYCLAHDGDTVVRRKVDDLEKTLGSQVPIQKAGWKADAGHQIVMVIGVRKSEDASVSMRCEDASRKRGGDEDGSVSRRSDDDGVKCKRAGDEDCFVSRPAGAVSSSILATVAVSSSAIAIETKKNRRRRRPLPTSPF